MSGFLACLKKDFCLFGSRAGIWILVLALLLIPAVSLAADNAAAGAFVQPFSVAIRDMDSTLMSRTLISQMGEVALFSDIQNAGDKTDAELFESGAAGVITLPKDLFYDLYSMDEQPIELHLNPEMPLESSLLTALVDGVAQIITADRAAFFAIHEAAGGGRLKNADYEEMAAHILSDALGRHKVFAQALDAVNELNTAKMYIFGAVMQVLTMLICLAVVRTLPEEAQLGITPRFHAAGGGMLSMFCSKMVCAWLLFTFVWSALWILIRPVGGAVLYTVWLCGFSASFALFLLLAVLVKGERAVVLANGAALWMLALGGAIYPVRLLPLWAQKLSRFTVGAYTAEASGMLAMGYTVGESLLRMLPLLLFAAVDILLSAVIAKRRSGQ